MASSAPFEPYVDFSEWAEPMERAALFLGVLAYPEAGEGDPETGRGAKFTEALIDYALWAARLQYGLGRLRSAGVTTRAREHWQGTLFRGGARVRRRLAAIRAWGGAKVWITGRPSAEQAEELAGLQRQSLRAFFLRDLERWNRAFRLDAYRGSPASKEDLVRQLRAQVNQSKPVFHMAQQLETAISRVGRDQATAGLPAAERFSWRRAWLLSPMWIDEAIPQAENFRLDQEPFRQNGLAANDMIELRWKTPPKFTPSQ